MSRLSLTLLSAILLAPSILVANAAPAAKEGRNSTNAFPGLPLMPAGSVVQGIVLPRYEDGRVVSLIKIATLKVLSVSLLSVEDLVAALYDESGNMTKIITPKGYIDFADNLVRSEGAITMEDPRFKVSGQCLHFNTLRKVGVLRGPVRTVLSSTQNHSQR